MLPKRTSHRQSRRMRRDTARIEGTRRRQNQTLLQQRIFAIALLWCLEERPYDATKP